MADKRILDCEWIILRALWGKEPGSMGEIIDAVRREHPEIEWKYMTYHSYLRVMLDKGLIGSEIISAKEKRYYPLISEEEALGQESESLLYRISEGAVGRMVAMMAEKGQISDSEKQQLADLFTRLSHESDGSCDR